MVIASRYDVTTHERWLSPPRSRTIVGSAVETIVWSSDASSITTMSAPRTAVGGRVLGRVVTRGRVPCGPAAGGSGWPRSREAELRAGEVELAALAQFA